MFDDRTDRFAQTPGTHARMVVASMQSLNASYELNSVACGQPEALIAEHNRAVSRVRSLSLVGDATPTGWSEARGLPLERERPDGDRWSAGCRRQRTCVNETMPATD